MPNSHIAYFGYGSLVNPATHRTDIVDTTKVRLKGCRRHWLQRPKSAFGSIALLSVKRDENSEIDGLVVRDFARNLSSLDEREVHYSREELHHANLIDLDYKNSLRFDGESAPVASIYVADKIPETDESLSSKILRSYLDAVMQGYLNNFGRDGLVRFMNTTDNFEIGIREDRANPIYPRSVTATQTERRLFDQLAPASR